MFVARSWTKTIVLTGIAVVAIAGATFAVVHKRTVSKSDADKIAITTASQAQPTPNGVDPSKLISLSARTWLATAPSVYEGLKVVDESGKSVTLDVRQTPMYFYQVWTDHLAVKGLADAWNNLKQKPVFISTAWPSNMPFDTVVNRSKFILNQMGIKDYKLYFLKDPNPFGKIVSGLPDTYVWQDNVVYHIPGTLPSSSDWVTVFNGGLKVSDKK